VANRRREIEVVKMIGGTDAFVRLPFLYQGALQGLLGAGVAVALTATAVALLDGAVAELAARYGGTLRLRGPGAAEAGTLAAVGAGLGWLGARLAAGRHVRALEPS
jgi:cell division transport system permease protein